MGSVVQGMMEAITKKDIHSFANLYANDAVMVEPLLPEPARGREQIAQAEEALFAAFSDIAVSVRNEIASGRVVMAEVVMSATNDGPLDLGAGEVPPTGRRIEVPMVWALDLDEEGLIAEERDYFDTGVVMQQLGLGE